MNYEHTYGRKRNNFGATYRSQRSPDDYHRHQSSHRDEFQEVANRVASRRQRTTRNHQEFNFADDGPHGGGPHVITNGSNGTNGSKYKKANTITPGAAITRQKEEEAAIKGGEEAHLLRKNVMPPKEMNDFTTNLANRSKRSATTVIRRTQGVSITTSGSSSSATTPRNASSSLEKLSMPLNKKTSPRSEWHIRKSSESNGTAAAAERRRIHLTPSPKSKHSSTENALAKLYNAPRSSSLLRSSPRLSHKSTAKRKAQTTPPSVRLRKSKRLNTDGTADQPIHLDSDSDSDHEAKSPVATPPPAAVVNGKRPNTRLRVQCCHVDLEEMEKEAICAMQEFEVWFGTCQCMADIYFCRTKMAICSIRTESKEWKGYEHYAFDYQSIVEFRICRLNSSESEKDFAPQCAYIALHADLKDSYLTNVYDSSGKDPTKRFILLCAKDKRGNDLGPIEDLLRSVNGQIVNLISPKHRMDYLKGMLAAPPSTSKASEATRSTRSRASKPMDDSDDDTNGSEKLLTYPLPPCTSDIVTITRQDLGRLQPAEYLNDNIIDYYFKRLMLETFKSSVKIQKNVLFLSSHFYSQLRLGKASASVDRFKAGYQNVATWLARTDFFNKSLIFIPINKEYVIYLYQILEITNGASSLHWSLAIIINPRIAARIHDEEVDGRSCIALLDPLGSYHSKAAILRQLRHFLQLEWENTCVKKQQEHETGDYDMEQVDAIYVKAPQQQNSFDCGVYVLQYAEVILKNYLTLDDAKSEIKEDEAACDVLPKDVTDNKLDVLIAKNSFTALDIDAKRQEILDCLAQDRLAFRRLVRNGVKDN